MASSLSNATFGTSAAAGGTSVGITLVVNWLLTAKGINVPSDVLVAGIGLLTMPVHWLGLMIGAWANKVAKEAGVSEPASATADSGAVKLGGLSPALATADAGRVRLGGLSPSL